MTRRRAFTLVEMVLAAALALALLGLLWALFSRIAARHVRVERRAAAVTAAETALAYLLTDLAALLPPDPARPGSLPRIEDAGRRITFLRVERRGDALVARPVLYEARPDASGSLELHRNGRRIPGVRLARLSIRLVRPWDARADPRGMSDLEVDNPVLEIVVTGTAPGTTHTLPAVVPLPATTPAAMRELPEAAARVLARAVRVDDQPATPPE